jgi:hypothetical protein
MLPENSFASNLVPANWKERLRRVISSPTLANPEKRTQPAIWYTGLAAEPSNFSRQLADLDLSIVRENQRAEVAAGKTQGDPH